MAASAARWARSRFGLGSRYPPGAGDWQRGAAHSTPFAEKVLSDLKDYKLATNILNYLFFYFALRSLRQLRGQGPLARPKRLFLDKNYY